MPISTEGSGMHIITGWEDEGQVRVFNVHIQSKLSLLEIGLDSIQSNLHRLVSDFYFG